MALCSFGCVIRHRQVVRLGKTAIYLAMDDMSKILMPAQRAVPLQAGRIARSRIGLARQ